MAKRGRLIVIDGSDGSGKATQTRLLIARLKSEGYKMKTLDFPQYEANFFGKLIGECLIGEYGDFVKIDPHIGSVLYAADRFESKPVIERWLKQGYTVVLDRYVSSNQIHQGGKILNPRRQREFLNWLDQMEHGVFGLPRPDKIIYLDVPTDISRRLLKSEDQIRKKVYVKRRKTDLVENDEEYLLQSRKNALRLVKKLNAWTKIDCVRRGKILSRESIAEKVWNVIEKTL
ncbi:MAG: thymidylate kinase [Candidatus Moraniibacteriota bacterium]|nr:MAG: thymidylate kinase [Candidatus Moranbacteria bacterium]